ncbi:MAG: sulfatase-like hydrolase/transferase [Acidobacteria bacterium]|nr:sulfatase-like hydrolase/transferase [Acidobacteriota bacterium]
MRKLLVLFGLAALSAAAAERPNVLFVAIDDLNDWIGVLGGHPQAKTPNLDRLAERGVLFTHAYTAAPACNPSRASLMTGIAPYKSGVYLNSQPWRPAMPNAVTIPQHFRKNGYWVGASGKIFHGAFPDPASWDEYWPSQTKNKPDDPKPAVTPVNGIPKTAHFDWGPVTESSEEMGDYQVVDWVVGKLNQKWDKPFFLACGMYKPHLPWYVPQKYFDMFPLERIELPSTNPDDLVDIPAAGVKMAKPQGDHKKVIDHNQYRQAVQGYLAAIAFVDEQIGRLLDAFDKSPRSKDTILILWTDHGWHLGEKQHWRKFALWEEATRTPLMMVVPKGVAPGMPEGTKAGTKVEAPVSLLDIYPTLVELAKLDANPALMGESLVPLLKDPKAKWDRASVTTEGRGNHAVRTPLYRYIRYADGDEELYDHRTDPMEWKNLARDPQYSAVIEGLRAWLPKTDAPDAPKGRGEE